MNSHTNENAHEVNFSAEDADALLAQMDTQEALLSCDEMDEIERKWNLERTTRRCALVLATKPFAWLRQKVETDRDFAKAVAEVYSLTKEIEFYSGMAELMNAAHVRAMVALCGREDMEELLAEAGNS